MGQPFDPPTLPTFEAKPVKSKRPLIIGAIVLAVLVAGGIGVATKGNDGTSNPSDREIVARLRTERLCGLNDSQPDQTAANGTKNEAEHADYFLGFGCGLSIHDNSDGYEFTTLNDDMINLLVSDFQDLDDALTTIGSMTGCWGPTDVSKIVGTRALDGRVDSANGRSSWTYHPDNGLSIVCEKV